MRMQSSENWVRERCYYLLFPVGSSSMWDHFISKQCLNVYICFYICIWVCRVGFACVVLCNCVVCVVSWSFCMKCERWNIYIYGTASRSNLYIVKPSTLTKHGDISNITQMRVLFLFIWFKKGFDFLGRRFLDNEFRFFDFDIQTLR